MSDTQPRINRKTSSSLVGATLGKGSFFEETLTKLLGSGAFGSVYKTLSGKVVKVLNEEHRRNEDVLIRFENEYEIASKLRHGGIVQCDGFVKEDENNHTYIRMEFIDGNQLNELMTELSTEQTVGLMRQELDALLFAHKKGVIHRDIKPENLIVTKDGVLKITDFGISKILEEEDSDEEGWRLTRTGQFIGTGSYSSPEQARAEPLTVLTDIYSSGSTFFEIFTGDVPHSIETKTKPSGEELSPMEKAIALVGVIGRGHDPVDIRERVPHLSEEIADYFRMIMAPKAENRLTTQQSIEEADYIIENKLFDFKPFVKPNTGKTRKEIKQLEAVIKQNAKHDRETEEKVYLGLADNYHTLALSTARQTRVSRKMKRIKAELTKLERRDLEQLNPNDIARLNKLRPELSSLVDQSTLGKGTRRSYFKQAAYYAEKGGDDYCSDLYRKKADSEKRRLWQIIERENKKPPGLAERIVSHPYTLPSAAVGAAGAAVLLFVLHGKYSREAKFDRAVDNRAKAEALLREGDLLEAKRWAKLAQDEYDKLSRNYNRAFIGNLEGFRRTVDQEIKLSKSLTGLEGLIAQQKFGEAKSALDRAGIILEDLPSEARREFYEKAIQGHRIKIKDKEDDIDDLEKILEKLNDIKDGIRKKSEVLSSGARFSSQEELDDISNKINRYYDRLNYDVVEAHVNPTKYKRASIGYPACEEWVQTLDSLSGAREQMASVVTNFQEAAAILTYLKGDPAADDGVVKIGEARKYTSAVQQALQSMGSAVGGVQPSNPNPEDKVYEAIVRNLVKAKQRIQQSLLGFGKILAVQTEETESLEKEVTKFDGWKTSSAAGDKEGSLRLGEYHFDRQEYGKARGFLTNGEEPASIFVKIMDMEEKDMKDPAKLAYRRAGDYDTDMLAQFKTMMNAYLAHFNGKIDPSTDLGEKKVIAALHDIKGRLPLEIDEQVLSEWQDAYLRGVKGAKDELAGFLKGVYDRANGVLQKEEPELLKKRRLLYDSVNRVALGSEERK